LTAASHASATTRPTRVAFGWSSPPSAAMTSRTSTSAGGYAHRAALVRPKALWDELRIDRESVRRGGTEWYTFLHPDGYAMYRVFGDDPCSCGSVSHRGHNRRRHCVVPGAVRPGLMEKVVFGTHPADPLPYMLTDHRVARVTHVEDELWLRIMDIPTALEARSYQSELSIVLGASDTFRSDGGPIRAGDSRGPRPVQAHGRRRRRSDGPRRAGSLYLGAHKASSFASANRLHTNDSALLAHLDARVRE